MNTQEFAEIMAEDCPDCAWNDVPEGCNVKRDSAVCMLNKESKGDIYET